MRDPRVTNNTLVVGGYCKIHAISLSKQAEILNGFDLTQPVYVERLFPPACIFQYIRLGSSEKGNFGVPRKRLSPRKISYESAPSDDPESPTVGNWFALRGATMDGLAVFSGLAGRRLASFQVTQPLDVLEGIASPQPRDSHHWKWAYAGHGGMTQMFIPRPGLFTLVSLGNA